MGVVGGLRDMVGNPHLGEGLQNSKIYIIEEIFKCTHQLFTFSYKSKMHANIEKPITCTDFYFHWQAEFVYMCMLMYHI